MITAPAGFGKTTLAASCIGNCGMPAAWLSLDRGDNGAIPFLRYLAAALHAIDENIGGEAIRLMAEPGQVSAEGVTVSILNDLDGASREMALMLDDYQFINDQSVHEAVAFLLDHLPQYLPSHDCQPFRSASSNCPPASKGAGGRTPGSRSKFYKTGSGRIP